MTDKEYFIFAFLNYDFFRVLFFDAIMPFGSHKKVKKQDYFHSTQPICPSDARP